MLRARSTTTTTTTATTTTSSSFSSKRIPPKPLLLDGKRIRRRQPRRRRRRRHFPAKEYRQSRFCSMGKEDDKENTRTSSWQQIMRIFLPQNCVREEHLYNTQKLASKSSRKKRRRQSRLFWPT